MRNVLQIDLANEKGFNFYLKVTDLFKESDLPDRRISSLVYKMKDENLTYYHIVGFHLFPLNYNFVFKKIMKQI